MTDTKNMDGKKAIEERARGKRSGGTEQGSEADMLFLCSLGEGLTEVYCLL